MNYNLLPDELKKLKQFTCWGKKGISQEQRKVPFNPITGRGASSTDSTTWVDFKTAVKSVSRGDYEGIGIFFDGGLMGIDLDHVINGNTITREANSIVKIIDSYTEKSQSGTGIHILCYGEKPSNDVCKVKFNDGQAFEMYDKERYFALTGDVIFKKYDLNHRTKEVEAVFNTYMQRNTEKKVEKKKVEKPTKRVFKPSNDIVQMMFNSKYGATIQRLWSGNLQDYENDPNRGDLALCFYLSLFTDGDPQKIDSLFKESGLYRDKWNEKRGSTTYGTMTIQRAVAFQQKKKS